MVHTDTNIHTHVYEFLDNTRLQFEKQIQHDIQIVKRLQFEGHCPELRPILFFLRQSWTKYLEQNRKT